MKEQFRFHTDPGHGWIEVPAALVARLGILSEISQYSYQCRDRMYLEEDCDAATFDAAMKKAGIKYDIVTVVHETMAPIRNYSRVRS